MGCLRLGSSPGAPSLSAWTRERGAGIEPKFQQLPGWDEQGRLDRPG